MEIKDVLLMKKKCRYLPLAYSHLRKKVHPLFIQRFYNQYTRTIWSLPEPTIRLIKSQMIDNTCHIAACH